MSEYCDREGKIIYKSPNDAHQHGGCLKKRHGGNVRVYKCRWCGGYHITSMQDRYAKKRGLHKKGK